MSATDDIRAVARRERVAAQTRTEAEAAWRAAWWETTMALAALDRVNVGGPLRAAADVLGVTVGYLRDRRMIGSRVDHRLESMIVRSLPPRATLAWAVAGRTIDRAAADQLLAAERDGVSIRDQARELGTQPTSWQREDERTATPEQIERAITERPGEVARLLGNAPVQARRDFRRAQEENTRERMIGVGLDPDWVDPSKDIDDEPAVIHATAMAELKRARATISDARRRLTDTIIDEPLRAVVVRQVEAIEAELRALRQIAAGHDLDRELAELLDGGAA